MPAQPGCMKVLLALDGSELSMRALDRTIDRAREAGDDLAVAVYEGAAAADVDEVAETATERLSAAGIDAAVHRLEDEAGSQIVELADDYDELVMGGGEISPMGKIRIGETIEFVLVNAQTTLTLVR